MKLNKKGAKFVLLELFFKLSTTAFIVNFVAVSYNKLNSINNSTC